MRAVAERAGVNERTVYRHFTNERGLRDAVMRRLEQQAGIDLDGLQLDDVPNVAARIIATIASHPREPRPELDPTLTAAGQREREALRQAVGAAAAGWSDDERRVAAAMLDVLLGVATYERLAGDWELDPDQAIAGVTWVANLIADAVRDGHSPIRLRSRLPRVRQCGASFEPDVRDWARSEVGRTRGRRGRWGGGRR